MATIAIERLDFNADGTVTVDANGHGMTFLSRADYEAWVRQAERPSRETLLQIALLPTLHTDPAEQKRRAVGRTVDVDFTKPQAVTERSR